MTPIAFSDTGVDMDMLDDYLQTLGPVQRTPTPPHEDDFQEFTYTTGDDYRGNPIYSDARMLKGMATKLCLMNEHASGSLPIPLAMMISMLEISRPSLTCIALTYNILASYQHSYSLNKRHDSTVHFIDPAPKTEPPHPEIIFLAVVKVASAFLDERYDPLAFWSTPISKKLFTEEEMADVSCEVYSAIGWKLPLFSTQQAIDSALAHLSVKEFVSRREKLPSFKIELPQPQADFLAVPTQRRKSSLVDPVSPYMVSKSSYLG